MKRKASAVERMWPGGPLRQFSKRQAGSHYVAYSGPFLTGYAGSYVCDRCLRPCAGVYYAQTRQDWLCGACRSQPRPRNQDATELAPTGVGDSELGASR